jgi:hypothetical protein
VELLARKYKMEALTLTTIAADESTANFATNALKGFVEQAEKENDSIKGTKVWVKSLVAKGKA